MPFDVISHTDSGLGHVTYLDQKENSRLDTSKSLENHGICFLVYFSEKHMEDIRVISAEADLHHHSQLITVGLKNKSYFTSKY